MKFLTFVAGVLGTAGLALAGGGGGPGPGGGGGGGGGGPGGGGPGGGGGPVTFRSIDGTGNNVDHPEWGAADQPLIRIATDAYADGIESPSGSDRPSARAISNAVSAQSESILSSAGASDFVWQWGQFIDHDLDLSAIVVPVEEFDIPVPAGDPYFDPTGEGDVVIPLERAFYVYVGERREQTNEITAYLDASNVYGSDLARATELRTNDGTGRLKTSAGDLLPFNENGFDNAPDSSSAFFLAGDVRANEQVGLTAMHTLFVREHNHWCDEIAADNPTLSGEQIYQRARRIIGAEIQAITFREFLPALLGPGALPPYPGYDNNRDASIANEFATAAYRFGHSMLSDSLLRLDSSGASISEGSLPLAAAFFNPAEMTTYGIEPLLRGLANQTAQQIDPYLVDGVRNFLFGPPGSGGFDLASLNIQRGRDHGLPSYVQLRIDLGLAPVMSFADISSASEVQSRLSSVYGSVDEIDPWVGGLSEDHLPGALVGETVATILSRQFLALRAGDRYWYQRDLPGSLRNLVEQQTLARIIRRNTTIGDEIPDNVFLVETAPPIANEFTRGDCNADFAFDVGDAITVLDLLFGGQPQLCADACDSNDDGLLDLGDAITTLSALFGGDPDLPSPHGACGIDPTADLLDCSQFAACP